MLFSFLFMWGITRMIKIHLTKGLGFYFCGSIALYPAEHTKYSPKHIDINSLTDKELLGLERGLDVGAISITEGQEELEQKLNKIKGIESPKEEEVKSTEDTDNVDETDESENSTEDSSEDGKTPRRRTRRSTTK